MVIQTLDLYLKPTDLCDFDKEIVRRKAEEVILGAKTNREKAEKILEFCQNEIIFAYTNWDEKASEVLAKRRGMCAGKSNLAVALLRSVGIPARHKRMVINFSLLESELWKFVLEKDSFLAKVFAASAFQKDHIVLEVYLDGRWELKDISFDYALKEGMKMYGILFEKEKINLQNLKDIEDFDQWARERQGGKNRDEILKKMNIFLDLIRQKVKEAELFQPLFKFPEFI